MAYMYKCASVSAVARRAEAKEKEKADDGAVAFISCRASFGSSLKGVQAPGTRPYIGISGRGYC